MSTIHRVAACLMVGLTLGLLHRVGAAREPRYDGHRQTSFYVAVRDGTTLAVDLGQPTTFTPALACVEPGSPPEIRPTRSA